MTNQVTAAAEPGTSLVIKLPFDHTPFIAQVSHEPCPMKGNLRVTGLTGAYRNKTINVFPGYCSAI